MRKKMKWLSIVVAMFMLITAVTPVFAQSETDPVESPTVVEETNGFLDHPIVKLLSEFFGGLFKAEVTEEPANTGDGTVDGIGMIPDPTEEPGTEGEGDEGMADPTLEPALAPDEQVAALHSEEDLGFGEITKLLQIVVEAKASCTLEGANCDVTLDSLIDKYQSGVGMGELFKIYGKPEITGVGQVKQEEKENNNANIATSAKVKTNNGKAKGKDK